MGKVALAIELDEAAADRAMDLLNCPAVMPWLQMATPVSLLAACDVASRGFLGELKAALLPTPLGGKGMKWSLM